MNGILIYHFYIKQYGGCPRFYSTCVSALGNFSGFSHFGYGIGCHSQHWLGLFQTFKSYFFGNMPA